MADKNIITDPRTVTALNGIHRTSLSDFLKVDEDDESNTTTKTDDADTVPNVQTDSEGATEETSDGDAEESNGDTSKEGEPVFDFKGEKVPLKDLLNSYETRQEISRRFDEVGKKELRLKQDTEKNKREREELDAINEAFEEMKEQVLAGNSLAALQIAMRMATAAGGEPKEDGLKDLIDQATKIAENFNSMSEEEQKVFLKSEELSLKEKRMLRAEAKAAKQKAAAELETYYNNFLETNKITDADMESALQDLVKFPQFKEELEKKDERGKIQYVGTWMLGKRINATVERGISKVDPELAKNNDFRLALLDFVDPRCTEDDVADIVRNYLNPSQNGSAKVESEASKKDVAPKKSTTPDRAPTEKPKAEKANVPITSFKDLINKYS